MSWLYRQWRRFLAFWRLDLDAVCEQSRGMAEWDYHDYKDSIDPYPYHFHAHTCARCGKEFYI